MQNLDILWQQTAFDENDEGERFIKQLVTEAKDRGIVNVDNVDEFPLPSYFDPVLFKRGQNFYHKYRNSFDFGTFVGTQTLLAIETMLMVLVCTNKSSTPAKAYKRYTENIIYHQYFLADSPEDSQSLCYRAIKSVRGKHKHGNKMAQMKKVGFISQKDMVLTLFSFHGYTFGRNDILNIPYEPEELHGIIHVWRVLGNLLGVEEEFNIFNGSLEEVIVRSKAILTHIFLPSLMHLPEMYQQMSTSYVEGLEALIPGLTQEMAQFAIGFFNRTPGFYLTAKDREIQMENLEKYPHYFGDDARNRELKEELEENQEEGKRFGKMSFSERLNIRIMLYVVGTLFSQTNLIRIVINWWSLTRLWFAVKFPIRAMIKFGKKNAYVDTSIMDNYKRDKKEGKLKNL